MNTRTLAPGNSEATDRIIAWLENRPLYYRSARGANDPALYLAGVIQYGMGRHLRDDLSRADVRALTHAVVKDLLRAPWTPDKP